MKFIFLKIILKYLSDKRHRLRYINNIYFIYNDDLNKNREVNHFSDNEILFSLKIIIFVISLRTYCVVQFLQTCLNFHIHFHIFHPNLDPRYYGLQSYSYCDVDFHDDLCCEQLTTQFHLRDVGFHESNNLFLLLGLHSHENLHV